MPAAADLPTKRDPALVPSDRKWTIQDWMRLEGIQRRTVYNWISSGRLPRPDASKRGEDARWWPATVRNFLDSQQP
jgi:hypothetical protein